MKSFLLAATLLVSINLYSQADVDSLNRRIDTLEQALKEKNYMRVPVGDLDKTLDIHVQSQMLKYLGILAVLLITGTFSIFKILQKNVAEEVKGKYATLENQMNEFNTNSKNQMNELYEDLKDKLTEIRDTFKEQLSEFKDTHKRENDRQDVTIKTVTDSVVSMRSRQESFLAEVSKDVEQKISEATRIIWNDIADNKIRTVKDLGFKGSSLAKELNEFLDNPSVKLSTDKKKQLVDALMRCFYYSDSKDLKEQGFDTNYNEMAKLLKKYDVLELLPETYATAAIAFNNIYEQHHMPEDKKFCLDCCDKSLNKSKDYGEAFAVKLEVYAIDYVKAFDDAEKQKSKEELKRIFHELKVSRSNYLHIDTLSRLYIDRNVKNLKVYFPIKKNFLGKTMRQFKAVDDVNFTVRKGETVGLVGESGCGKTTLGRALIRLTKPTSGNIFFEGRDIANIPKEEMRRMRKKIQIIFQDPYGSLNPRITVGSAIQEPLKVHGLLQSDSRRKQKVLELLNKVNLRSEHFNRYPHEFSGGQRQRICIARALALNPDFLICDESVSALDVSVQAQVLNLLNDLKKEFGFTTIFISHDIGVVRYISDTIMVMNKGRIVESGASEDICLRPQNEYTKKLISSVPKGLVA